MGILPNKIAMIWDIPFHEIYALDYWISLKPKYFTHVRRRKCNFCVTLPASLVFCKFLANLGTNVILFCKFCWWNLAQHKILMILAFWIFKIGQLEAKLQNLLFIIASIAWISSKKDFLPYFLINFKGKKYKSY